MIGRVISHYRIVEKLGSGGMGVVYKAEDLKLDRQVALKFLPPYFAGNNEDLGRFIREAKTASSLQHDNICAIYEIDESADGHTFISMAYYEGETLQNLMRKADLSLDAVTDIVIQIAQGLAFAHENQIVHRDIKPANILISDKRIAKILDFGLAKSGQQTGYTKTKSTLGTAAYMSPEQASGELVDYRTDVWSLGIVLYQMLTGRLPFRGDYDQAMIYSIVNEMPNPVVSEHLDIPSELEWIVERCLEKDKEYRYQNMTDLLADLKRVKRDLNIVGAQSVKYRSRKISPQKNKKRINNYVYLIMAIVATIAFLIGYHLPSREAGTSATLNPNIRLVQLTSGAGLETNPTWSSDGQWIAYASDESGNMDIWKKSISTGSVVQLTTGNDNETEPAWSPDGSMIAFSSDSDSGGICLIPAGGGESFTRVEFGANPVWSPSGQYLVFDWRGSIYRVHVSGGEPEVIVGGNSAPPYSAYTQDGKHLLYWNRTLGDICLLSIDGNEARPLNLIESGYEVSGLCLSSKYNKLFYCSGPFGGNKNIMMVQFNMQSLAVSGSPIPVGLTTSDDIHIALSPDETKLAYTVRAVERQLYLQPLDISTGLPIEHPQKLTSQSTNNYYPCVSPHGKDVMWTSHQAGQGVLFYKNISSVVEKKVTPEWKTDVREIGASFSNNGDGLYYSSTHLGSYELWHIPKLGGAALPLTNTNNPTRDVHTVVASDGSVIFFSNRLSNWDIWTYRLNRELVPLTNWESNELYPSCSPISKKIAFATNKSGQPDIWMMNIDGSNPQPYITTQAEEGWSAWSPDESRFYFVSDSSGTFNIWMKIQNSDKLHQVTSYKDLSFGLPESILFTKFAVTSEALILPLEKRDGDIHILENLNL